MKKEIIDTLPYSALQELINLREYLTEAFSKNSFLLSEIKNLDDEVFCEYQEPLNNYVFILKFVKYDEVQRKILYNILKRPASTEQIVSTSNHLYYDQIAPVFEQWVSDVNSMIKIKFHFLNPNKDFYDTEFSDFITNNDADADTAPFDLNRQEILYYFLNYAQKNIENSTDIDDSQKEILLLEVNKIKDEIPTSTKKKVVTTLSKFAQTIKGSSNKLFHDIFDILKKELIKHALYKGLEKLPEAYHQVKHWIDLFS